MINWLSEYSGQKQNEVIQFSIKDVIDNPTQ